MLAATLRQREQQRQLVELAQREAHRRAVRGSLAVAQIVGSYQAYNIEATQQNAPDVLAEQGIPADAAASVNARSLLTAPRASAGMLSKVANQAAFDRLVATLVQDAGRTAAGVDMATRTHVTGYVRALSGSSCARCAVLAGRVYRWSQGFQRHPNCDCVMLPTTETVGRDLITDPMEAFAQGRIHGLSRADTKAINSGADISQVVNVRRKQAGLIMGGSVMERAGRLTPAGIFRIASDQAEALTLLRRYGYVA